MAELPHSYFSFNFCIPYVIPPRQEPACSAGISPPVLLRSHSSRLSVIILLLRLLPELRKVRSTSYRVVPPDLSCILMHPPELLCTPIIPRLSVVCIELVVYFPGMPYLIIEPFLHVDTLLATFLFHRILLSLFPNLQILLCHAAKTLFIDNFKERILIPVQRFSNPFNRLNSDHKLLIWIFTIIE